MKKIIDGRLYNTDTAREIDSWDNGFGATDFKHCSETLYKKKNGEYFLYGSGGAMSIYSESCGNNEWTGGSTIIPLTETKAKKWAETKLSADEYIEEFGCEE